MVVGVVKVSYVIGGGVIGGRGSGKEGDWEMGSEWEEPANPISSPPDVNECLAQSPICHNSTICKNTQGSYSCHCRLGWLPKAGYRNNQKNTICEGNRASPTRAYPCPSTHGGPLQL